jgi:hypothetical protein
MSDYMSKKFLNKQVQLYPNDTYSKFAIVRDINDSGVVFEITKSERASDYIVGSLVFIAYSARLNFTLV